MMKCDYLVIGAGAASLAFVDTLLTELPNSTVVIIDKRDAPGGHWVDAYGFVRLHQPSLLYGVASKQMEGNWLKLILRKRMLPWKHRASKDETLDYFQKVVDEKVAQGQLHFYPNCQYDFQQDIGDHSSNVHRFSSIDGKNTYTVEVGAKLINGTLGECKIPSKCPVQFPVDPDVNMITPNQLFDFRRKEKKQKKNKKYIVLGAGKTGMDTVVYLLRVMKVKPRDIFWVISNDVWMLSREGPGSPWSWPTALLEHNQDRNKASLALEKKGVFVRLDETVQPTKFRFPVIGKDELEMMRSLPKENLVRRGRVTSILVDKKNSKKVLVGFGDGKDPWEITAPMDSGIDFLHCTSPGPLNGNTIDELFVSDKELNLFLLFAPPVSISMSVLAYLEASRQKGKLDIQFGRKLLLAFEGKLAEGSPTEGSENDVLRRLIRAIKLDDKVTQNSLMTSGPIRSILSLALFFALVDEDPLVGYNWLKGNRLSFFSIPGFKGRIYETMDTILAKDKASGLSQGELRMITLLRERLEPLAGK